VVTYKDIEGILQTYTLEEILEYNSLTSEDALLFLVEEEFLELPNVQPVDYEVS
jgi:hypothetical protein